MVNGTAYTCDVFKMPEMGGFAALLERTGGEERDRALPASTWRVRGYRPHLGQCSSTVQVELRVAQVRFPVCAEAAKIAVSRSHEHLSTILLEPERDLPLHETAQRVDKPEDVIAYILLD